MICVPLFNYIPFIFNSSLGLCFECIVFGPQTLNCLLFLRPSPDWFAMRSAFVLAQARWSSVISFHLGGMSATHAEGFRTWRCCLTNRSKMQIALMGSQHFSVLIALGSRLLPWKLMIWFKTVVINNPPSYFQSRQSNVFIICKAL